MPLRVRSSEGQKGFRTLNGLPFPDFCYSAAGLWVARMFFSSFLRFSLHFAEHGVALALLLLHTEEIALFLEILY
jgi:hypothetical protein